MDNFTNFTKISDSADSLRKDTLDNGTDLITLGIPFFDDAFRGISKTDVVLLGAGSGAGKSEAAFHIAFHNASKGKKVLMFALEAEKREVELRQLYKIISRMFFEDPTRNRDVYINYSDFYFGRLWEHLDKYHDKAIMELKKSSTLFIRYSPDDYTLDNFAVDVESFSDADLIVLDHFHYLALGDEPENKAFKLAVKKIRSTVLSHNIPVILVAQLRKDTASTFGSVMPDLSDFHGSSDIFKIATKGIMFASGDSVVNMEDSSENIYRRPTIVKAVKNRIDGSVKSVVGCMAYDFRTNTYEKDYMVGKLVYEKDEVTKRNVEVFKPEINKPRWAKNAKF